MNSIAQTESTLAVPAAPLIEPCSAPAADAPRAPLGGFPDPAAAQRQADRAAAARLAALIPKQRLEDLKKHIVAHALDEAREAILAAAVAGRRASFWSGWRHGLVWGIPIGSLAIVAAAAAGLHWAAA
ncbi:hypothetical protein [Rhizobacter sp. SG703]|uniref:hypothetical protein n=1 Tax=Rhizobacter sp. SG703 TaxID=2587140 RepID=UPI0014476231|nr:hypothetical protein [Rhizobacter sp. SG703]NKI94739.1 hypothetical protein [Rhizobacter sp. SG703]